jgi:mRNA interferase RelE/StbE
MTCKIEFHPEAEKDFAYLDGSVRKEAAGKIDVMTENPYWGKPPGNKFGINLTGFYKLYFAKKIGSSIAFLQSMLKSLKLSPSVNEAK